MNVVHSEIDDPCWESVKAQIGRIRRAFGASSVTCGVLHRGEPVFHYAEGLADIRTQRVADADTIYPIASCSKAFTAATCAALVDEGLLSWDKPVSSYLPEFQTVNNAEVSQEATLVDLCSHSTGLAPLDHAIIGFHDSYLNDAADQVKISSNLPVLCDFRTAFVYNNFMYGVVGEVISRVCNKSLGSVMADKIFEPLGLLRTHVRTADYPLDGNVAQGYSVLDDGSFLAVGDPEIQDGSVHAGAGLVRSTVNDMLRWAKAVMLAEKQQLSTDPQDTSMKRNLLPGVAFTRSARTHIVPDSTEGENSYGLGWFRHTIPSRWLGSISPNFMLLPDPPVIGQHSPERLAICHYGAIGGFLSALYTFPETCSAVVVLANSSPSRGDPTDLIAQCLCQELFDMKPRVPLEHFALKAAETSKLIWPALVRNWVLARDKTDIVPVPIDYIGTYRNSGLQLRIDVFESQRSSARSLGRQQYDLEPLSFTINKQARQTAKLKHYHWDVWTFLPNTRDDASRKGMELYMALPLVLLSFVRDNTGQVRWLDWDLYGGYDQPELSDAVYTIDPVRFDRISSAAFN
ncbi:beta-lactamase/transpeptidase-like protein [Hypoxylon rubiginosum]|uniref:Beta-lactamase/transpeptidase-like protein n=1 Tax=Hypoxylon rubiginosum TaxID=110542 RepID=A0ACC0DCV1_9PEZI|nr:beta-lactamase/transpeptidase-like protein [Hypoxylon rubiginosum]